MNTVSAPLIVKNEVNNIPNLLDTLCPILEEVIIVDTGSTDGTIEVVQERQKKYPNLKLHHFKWVNDFSAARNYAFSLADAKCAWRLFIDGDDQIDPIALRKFKDTILDNDHVDAWLLDYIYSRFPDGSPQTVLGRERFLRASCNPRWIGAIHETVDISRMRQADYKDLKIVHNRTGKVIDPRRNLKILEQEFAKNPNDPRTCYYYGKELFDHVDDQGIQVLERYLTLPGRWYDDEVNARFRLGKAYIAQGKHGEAVRMAQEIYHLDGTRKRAESYWLQGRVEQDLHNYEMAIRWYQWCLDTPPPPPRVLNLEYYTWNPTRRIAECYQALGKSQLALEWAQKVQKLLPTDPETVKWVDSLSPKIKVEAKGGLRILEFDIQLRQDSTQFKPGALDLAAVSLETESLDGIIVRGQRPQDLVRCVKPGGFAWIVDWVGWGDPAGLQYLGTAVFNGQQLRNYIKIDFSKPSLYIVGGDNSFGPTRIRQYNLKLSAIKAGFNVSVSSEAADYYVAPTLSKRANGKTLVLDLCEALPKEVYDFKGIQYADVVTVCTETLQQYVQRFYPQKKIVVVEDHFEMQPEEWL